ncbi:hypothetical protein VTN77DRAFT_7171 [Rasamsonia byssochlamydoides]|uniref:uncharacterized protein n=1 Tax=Rasamsonia byssochlamydoides TaxID=89139 RepID=UPI00374200BE
MGNNPSKGPSGDSPAPTSNTPAASGNERRVNRRVSINALSGAKATAADPSASKESATGQPIPQSQTPVQQRLQSRNIPHSAHRSHETPDKRDGRKFRDGTSLEASSPVQVPSSSGRAGARHDGYPSVAPSGPPLNTYYAASHLQRPPRLPLPIGDANATPGSPIMDSQAASLPYDRLDNQTSRAAVSLDNTSVDEDEVEDELQSYAMSGVGKAVPTVIEWRGPGDRVYVTGTFVNWEKKFRLHKSETEEGVKSTTLQLRPGTHHLKFIVDGEMRASDNLPTAVDFTNHLVNYIEVSADEIDRQRSRRESDRAIKSIVPRGIHPPQVLPEAFTAGPAGDTVEGEEEQEEPEEEIPLGDFRRTIPQFLLDIDKDEDSPAYQRAANVIGDAPPPPSLPLFLGRSILNGTTPLKDDNSVLNYPNHTVLNHLATSSIKNGVLATSVTTRYKRKYVTTILYKPTGDITD